jgi:hypothetical protein
MFFHLSARMPVSAYFTDNNKKGLNIQQDSRAKKEQCDYSA